MPEVRAHSKKRRIEKPAAAPVKKRAAAWWIYAAALAVALYVAFQVYAPALNGPYVFDDTSLPYHTAYFPEALRAWISGVRPLLMFSYWLNYQVSRDPFSFHLVNVLLHLVNALLIFLIVRKFDKPGLPAGPLAAGFAAAVFLLHPIQTEAVSYVAGRSEVLSVLFFLSAFCVFLYRREAAVSWRIAIAVLALFGAALASKEHTLVLPALLLLTDYYWNPGFSFNGIRRNWRLYAPIAAAAAAGGVIVARVLSAGRGSAGFGLQDFTWYQYFFTQCRAFFVYLRLFVFPAGQNLDWDFPISRGVLDHGAIVGLLTIGVLIAAAIYYRHRYPLASYGFLVYILLMAPTSSFVPIKDPIAERRLYLPMIGLLFIVTAILQHVRLDRRKLAAALSAIVILLAIATYQRNQLWGSDIALWEDTVAKSPAKLRGYFQLGHTYYTSGRCQDAVREFTKAAAVQKPDYGLLVDWGLSYDCLDQPDQAIARLRDAAALDATAHVYTQIAMVYAKRSRWPEALEALSRAETLDPTYDMIYDNRGGIRARNGDLSGAAADYRHALAINPDNEHARQMLDIVERQMNRSR